MCCMYVLYVLFVCVNANMSVWEYVFDSMSLSECVSVQMYALYVCMYCMYVYTVCMYVLYVCLVCMYVFDCMYV